MLQIVSKNGIYLSPTGNTYTLWYRTKGWYEKGRIVLYRHV